MGIERSKSCGFEGKNHENFFNVTDILHSRFSSNPLAIFPEIPLYICILLEEFEIKIKWSISVAITEKQCLPRFRWNLPNIFCAEVK